MSVRSHLFPGLIAGAVIVAFLFLSASALRTDSSEAASREEHEVLLREIDAQAPFVDISPYHDGFGQWR